MECHLFFRMHINYSLERDIALFQDTRVRVSALGAEDHLDGIGADTARQHALAPLGQARRCIELGAVFAGCVDAAGPEDFASGAGAGP